MKKKFTSFIIIYFFFLLVVNAQPDGSKYGRILYRVNAGGSELNSKDTSSVKWGSDYPTTPSPYIDTTIVGNKTFTIADTILFNPSVPPNTPVQAFKSERGLATEKPATVLDWNFSIPAGTEIEVRLYFAEIFFNAANERKFNVKIEGITLLTNYDIFSEVGHNVGVMKNFIVTSDGNLDIDLVKVLQQPKINAIEIIELLPGSVAGIFNSKNENLISAYPNPFRDVVSIDINTSDISEIKIYDAYGKDLGNVTTIASSGDTNMDLSGYPVGIYFLQIASNNGNKSEMVRLIKQ